MEKLVQFYNFKVHKYADDVQLYTTCDKKSDLSDLAKSLEEIKRMG